MKQLLIAMLVAFGLAGAPVAVNSASAADTTAANPTPGAAMDAAMTDKATPADQGIAPVKKHSGNHRAPTTEEAKTIGKKGPKHCNPAKSKPCGNACIPKARECHADASATPAIATPATAAKPVTK